MAWTMECTRLKLVMVLLLCILSVFLLLSPEPHLPGLSYDQSLSLAVKKTQQHEQETQHQIHEKEQLYHAPIDHIAFDSRISTIDMKLICDYHYGTLPQPNEHDSPQILRSKSITSQNAESVPLYSVIFVDTPSVRPFLEEVAPKVPVPFVLVSGDSDGSNPGSMEEAVMGSNMLRRGKILHWYAMNCQITIIPGFYTCIPNGISSWGQQREDIQAVYEEGIGLDGVKQRVGQYKRESPMALIAFGNTNPSEREPLVHLGCESESEVRNLTECAYREIHSHEEKQEFYRYVSTFKFVFSPHGMGLDCFRTYEALYLGCYLIVKTSSLDALYENLPVLIVQEWADVTKTLLDDTYAKFQSTDYDFSQLYRQYWNETFRSHFN